MSFQDLCGGEVAGLGQELGIWNPLAYSMNINPIRASLCGCLVWTTVPCPVSPWARLWCRASFSNVHIGTLQPCFLTWEQILLKPLTVMIPLDTWILTLCPSFLGLENTPKIYSKCSLWQHVCKNWTNTEKMSMMGGCHWSGVRGRWNGWKGSKGTNF